jgi:hypothetical protein
MAEGTIQPTLFDDTDMAEITSPDYPGERLIACYNPFLAADRARKRGELLAATEAELDKIAAATRRARRPLRGKDKIALAVGKVINKKKVAGHFITDITDDGLSWRRDENKIAAEAALDGIYVIRTSLPAAVLGTGTTVESYKALENVERVFRGLNTDLLIRPIRHRLEDRVKAHVLIRLLATTSPGTCSTGSRPCYSKTTTPPPPGPPGPARSPPPAARPRRWPRTLPSTPPTARRCTAWPPCWRTWPPSPPTTSSLPAARPPSPSSPRPHQYSGAPSTCSASPTASGTRSQPASDRRSFPSRTKARIRTSGRVQDSSYETALSSFCRSSGD